MADWPATVPDPSEDFVEKSVRAMLRSESDAGYIIQRPRYTATKKEFHLSWKALSSSEKSEIENFFNNTIGWGDSFNWTHPITSTVYTVQCMDDELNFEYVSRNKWRLKLVFREV